LGNGKFDDILVVCFNSSSETILFRYEYSINLINFRVVNIAIFEYIVIFLLYALQVFILKYIRYKFMIVTNEI
jgi:type IV secretory pathway TrbL component